MVCFKVIVNLARFIHTNEYTRNKNKEQKQLKQFYSLVRKTLIKDTQLAGGSGGGGVNHLAFYKRGRGVQLGTTEKQLQLMARAGLEIGVCNLSATLPTPSSLTYGH